MKDVNMLIWLTQLGISVAVPLAGFLMLAVWLHNSCGWGKWVIIAGLIFGLSSAISGFRNSLKAMQIFTKNKSKEQPPVSFNAHD
jgi:hypothetical protein